MDTLSEDTHPLGLENHGKHCLSWAINEMPIVYIRLARIVKPDKDSPHSSPELESSLGVANTCRTGRHPATMARRHGTMPGRVRFKTRLSRTLAHAETAEIH